jgi:hypothetical protein
MRLNKAFLARPLRAGLLQQRISKPHSHCAKQRNKLKQQGAMPEARA